MQVCRGSRHCVQTQRTKFGARYYNPYRGRFTQPDPSGQEGNRYLYAGADQVNTADPSGLDSGLVGGTFCVFVCASLGLAQDSTGQYGLAASFGVGPELSASGTAQWSPQNVSTGISAVVSCQAGPLSGSFSPGSWSVGVSTPDGLGCDYSIGATLAL
ncbi:hypothetical protein OIT41_20780 (plasmid) [Arthrobacter sp. YA7-1]|uniref:RHS repeat-associated core domain-containing protein n=1 Tax=Arthrobacter sp. YA7-1 TaxID=2987701 RepID=UPI0022269EAA|nr:RHS repeat-associated core domain-containing protein [Arthrobacter sp. YA7-1]UYY83749.1 hypothetical protein OIT41_20780 [Arthrobacter sp. YA7-1]